MNTSKKWYQSKGIWGALITVIAVIAGGFGYSISPEEQESLVVMITSIVSGIGGLIAFVGRKKAEAKIE